MKNRYSAHCCWFFSKYISDGEIDVNKVTCHTMEHAYIIQNRKPFLCFFTCTYCIMIATEVALKSWSRQQKRLTIRLIETTWGFFFKHGAHNNMFCVPFSPRAGLWLRNTTPWLLEQEFASVENKEVALSERGKMVNGLCLYSALF